MSQSSVARLVLILLVGQPGLNTCNDDVSMLQVHSLYDVTQARSSQQASAEGPIGTRGFVFIGISSRRNWCDESKNVIESLNVANLSCRRDERRESYCKYAFIGDEPAVRQVQASCPGQFDVLDQVDLNECSLVHGDDLRPAKLCVRALALAPFMYNIQMDFDAIVMSNEIERVFAVLQKGYDLTAAYECCAMNLEDWKLADDALLHGWEMQSGVLGYTNASVVATHAKTAIKIYVESVINKYSSAEQNAETQALAEVPLRFFTLPPNFNMRYESAAGFELMPMAVAQFKYNSSKPVQQLIAKAKHEVKKWLPGATPSPNSIRRQESRYAETQSAHH